MLAQRVHALKRVERRELQVELGTELPIDRGRRACSNGGWYAGNEREPPDAVLKQPWLLEVRVRGREVPDVARGVLHGHGRPQVDRLPDRQALEPRFRDADHADRRAVHSDRGPDDARVASETSVPERVAQDRDRSAIRWPPVLDVQRATGTGADPKHPEPVTGDELRGHRLGLVTGAYVEAGDWSHRGQRFGRNDGPVLLVPSKRVKTLVAGMAGAGD